MNSLSIIGARGIPKNFIGTSGVETYIEHQLHKLTKRYNVTCYIHKWASITNKETYLKAKIIRIPTINTTYFDTFVYSLLSTIHATRSQSDIIWYHGVGPAFFSFIPYLFKRKVYTTIHTREWERRKWSILARYFLKFCERISLTFSTKIFVVSNNLRDYYIKEGVLDVVLQKYPIRIKTKPTSTNILKKYNLKKNSYILFIGRFVPEKRVEWIITASSHLNLPIVLVGGSSHSDTYVRFLQGIARGRQVVFTGYLFNHEKDILLSNCGLFVLPSQIEGLPISVVEALEFNKPCLVGEFLSEEFKGYPHVRYFKTDNYVDFLDTLFVSLRKIGLISSRV